MAMCSASPAPGDVHLCCDEIMERTRISCDEMTDFQRIVSLRVTSMYGRWSYSQMEQRPLTTCPRCHQLMQDEDDPCQKASPTCHPIQRARGTRLETVFCKPWERASLDGCAFAQRATEQLERRELFEGGDAELIRRVERASQSIHSVGIY